MTMRDFLSAAREILPEKGSAKGRRDTILIALIVISALLIIPLFLSSRSTVKEVESLRVKTGELSTLGSEYGMIQGRVSAIEQRKSLGKVSGIAQAVDDIGASLGLKGKVKGVKALGSREVTGGMEESAEVQIEKLTMNELVNMFYKIENAPMMLSIRRAGIRKTFENPELLNVTLTLALVSKK